MKILKVLVLQLFWFLAVSTNQKYQIPLFLLSIVIAVANFKIYKPQISRGHYIFTAALFVLYGMAQELSFEKFGLVKYNQSSFPLWLTSLYVVFIAYYGDLFNYLYKLPKALVFIIGAVGGIAAYYGGVKISPIEVQSSLYYVFVGLGWGAFLVFSFKIFYEGFLWNKLLDSSILYSFDKSGFLRHQKGFNQNDELKFKEGAQALVTGGTSGIGQATAMTLADNGVKVTITGRNPEKGKVASEAHERIDFLQWDMANWNEIEKVSESAKPFDYVVLNAGGMPDKFQTNDKGVELQFASQLFGHYFLIKKLKEKNKLKEGAKIVWVTSGGMYLASLDLKTIFENPKYDKVATYANVKRAQVTLLPYFKKEFPNQTVTAMHPGWAETPGVSSAIPEFDKKMKGKLRTPLQAADTILWLLGTKDSIQSGELYFDRRKVKKHFFWFTKKSDKEREHLAKKMESFSVS